MRITEPDNVEHAAFGVLLKRYRVAAGLSQEALAERARLSVRAVSAYERGERQAPYRDSVALLVQALGLSPEEAATLEAAVPRRRGPEATPSADDTAASITRPPETPPTNLPMQLTSFVGRRNELAEVLGLLDQSRLLTLIGAGGAGKSRLALQAAGAVPDRYPDGVWLVELAPLTDAAAVPRAVAAALGLGEDSDAHPVARLQRTVRGRALLLVLDNCEHLLDACAGLADALLRAGPRLRILATSREALGIAGENSWRVPSLALPDDARPASPDALLASEAVQLFVERARAALPSFALTARNARAVAQVCRRLDGMPLAIELAAARVRGLAVDQLAARLDQRFQLLTGGSRTALARQQTLRATVDWSYGLLDPDERRLFDQLSVFAGGFTLEGAEAVCAGDGPAAEVLDVLLRLVDKSLVATEEGEDGELRYRLLETLRAYGQERLASGGSTAALQARHARYYLVLAERAERGMRGPEMTRWLDRLDSEYANLTAALDWSLSAAGPPGDLDPGDAAIGLRLAGALWLFWFLRGHRWTGLQWLERALGGVPEPPPARAKALRNAGFLGHEVGASGRTLALLEEGLTLSRLVDEPADLAETLCEAGGYLRGEQVGFDIGHRGDYERGSALLAEGMALARAVGDPWRVMWSLLWDVGTIDLHRAEERERVRAAVEEGLRLARVLGSPLEVAFMQRTLGCMALAEGDHTRARAAFSASLAATRALGDRGGIAADLKHLADTARAAGDLDGARAGYEESLALYRELDFDREWQAGVLCRLGQLALEQGDLPRARAHLRESLRVAHALAERGAPQVAPALEALAGVAADEGRAERALRLAAAAAELRARLRLQPWPIEQEALARRLAPARRALSEPARETAWLEGQSLSLDQAIAHALEDEPAG